MNNPEKPSEPAFTLAPEEKACEFLKRARESKRITLEKMAKDSRLNLEYLYALEQGDYHVLPAQAYVRIYLRSAAKYLQIDPDEVVRLYEKEVSGQKESEKKRTTRGLTALYRQSKMKPIGALAVLFILFIILSFLRTGNKLKKVEPVSKGVSPIAAADTAKDSAMAQPKEPEKKTEPALKDTTVAAKPVTIPSSFDSLIHLSIKCVRESSWVLVYTDTASQWRHVIAKDRSRNFKAKKSFQLALGRAETIALYINNKRIEIPQVRGVSRYNIDATGIRIIGTKEWETMFPNEKTALGN
jgi:cytoskeleton protein RodZ